MKRSFLFFLTAILLTSYASAQKVSWATKVISYSSQKSDKKNSANQVVGEPSVFPLSGDKATAWCPDVEDSKTYQYIRVRMDKPTFVKQVVVAETWHPGAIIKIYLYDTNGDEHLVFDEKKPEKTDLKARLFSYKLPAKTRYKVRGVKVELNTKLAKGFNQIDAIGILDTDDNVKVEVGDGADIKFTSSPENLGKNVNSPSHDFIPQISPDGKTLYFARYHPENTGGETDMDIWYSSNNKGTWSEAKLMPKPLNDKNPNSLMTITPDGNTILLSLKYYKDKKNENGVSLSTKRRGQWVFPKPQTIKSFSSFSPYAEYCLAASKKVMLMTLDNSESYGDNDIYVSFLNRDKTWTKPLNLGNVVNTADVEMSPFLAADGVTLYFASAGHRGYGKEDIYMTKRLDETWTNWSKPVNLGSAINTQERDGYYSIPASGEYAYFTSKKKTLGGSDIFRIKLPDAIKPKPTALLYGKVIDGETNKPLEADLLYEILPEGAEMGTAISDEKSGDYKIVLPMGAVYGIYAAKKGYISVNESADFSDTTKAYVEIKQDITMYPLKVGSGFQLKNVRFERSKFELLASSFPELDRLVEVMKQNTTMEIVLEGHTDNTGSQSLNLKLSVDRVEAVKAYLKKKGIAASRVQVKGYGGSKPIANNGFEATRKLNRRVELKILKL